MVPLGNSNTNIWYMANKIKCATPAIILLRKLFSLAVALFSALIVKNNYLINLLLFIYNNFRKFGGKILPTLNVAKKQYHAEIPR
jgi:hypothetical protein